ncbi:hypothetical protein [Hyphomicrobium sp.]|uniref:hypothetical protein n=1 Tax=Hyphomicrobium sp. TaxID=82 RepID=UPI001DE111E4|nr:hypothetical protein [Hyphomicrobium sp.]MBY0561513.1 hypothetical protein [Hyphomicrobium sp.]
MADAHTVPDPQDELVATKLMLLRPGRMPILYERTMRTAPSLKEIKAQIEPLLGLRPLERVAVLYEGQQLDMFVDEMSALDELPRNDVATSIYRNNWLTQYSDTDPEMLPAIYGPAVLAMRRIWF